MTHRYQVSGDFIVWGSYTVSNATLNGRLLGGSGTLTLGNAFVENAPPGIPDPKLPEPADWILLTGGFGALIWFGKRQSAARRRFPLAARVRERIEADAGESGE